VPNDAHPGSSNHSTVPTNRSRNGGNDERGARMDRT